MRAAGGIGRHKGLRILRYGVRVQIPRRVPEKQQGADFTTPCLLRYYATGTLNGFTWSALGSFRLNMPSLTSAVILLTSTALERRKTLL